jgi:hypothetical protein
MILYGWNNYLLKSVQPHELGVYKNEVADIQIQYRQKYFHLFFIPVFPLGRFWAIRQGGKLYEPSPEMRVALGSVDVKTKHTLWAWSGIFLVLGAMFIYNISEGLAERSSKKRSAEHAALLAAFFKDPGNTKPLASKLRSINYLVDSSVNDEEYEKKAIDTGALALLTLFLDIKRTQTDSLDGFSKTNTFVFTLLDHKKNKGELPGDQIKTALSEGTWSGYSDTGSVFRSLRQLRDYKYVLVLKEYNRLRPTLQQDRFSSGVSLVDAYVMSIEDKSILHKFKVLGTNSDSVSHFTFRRRGEQGNVSSTQWSSVLENDLNKNVVKEAFEYIFRDNVSTDIARKL